MTKHLCVLPWIHLHAEGNKLYPCCRSNTFFPGVEIDDDRPLEGFNHKYFQDLRATMLAGEKPEVCRECWDYEENGITSLRERSNQHYHQEYQAVLKDQSKEARANDIKYIASLASNHCNLACRSCEPRYSSRWNHDAKKLGLIEEEISYDHRYHFSDFKNCQRFYFVGGEPLLKKDHLKELQAIIEHQKANEVELNYSTNFSYPMSTLDQYAPLWKQFKEVKLYASLDHMEASKYEYLRYPGKWSTVEKNIDYIHDQLGFITLGAQPTISRFNIGDLDIMINFFLNRMKIHPHNILLNPLLAPEHYASTCLPPSEKKHITEKLNQFCKKLIAESNFEAAIVSLTKNIQGQIARMNSEDTSRLENNFKQQTQDLDELRNQNYSQLKFEREVDRGSPISQ